MKAAVLRKLYPRIFAIVFEPDEEVMAGLQKAAARFELTGSSFTAIGALSSVKLGYFDRNRKDYKEIAFSEQVEVLSLSGNIAEHENELKVHAHMVGGRSDASTIGGHLLHGIVWPTLEVIITEPSTDLVRTFNEEAQLPLLDPGAGSDAEQITI